MERQRREWEDGGATVTERETEAGERNEGGAKPVQQLSREGLRSSEGFAGIT